MVFLTLVESPNVDFMDIFNVFVSFLVLFVTSADYYFSLRVRLFSFDSFVI